LAEEPSTRTRLDDYRARLGASGEERTITSVKPAPRQALTTTGTCGRSRALTQTGPMSPLRRLAVGLLHWRAPTRPVERPHTDHLTLRASVDRRRGGPNRPERWVGTPLGSLPVTAPAGRVRAALPPDQDRRYGAVTFDSQGRCHGRGSRLSETADRRSFTSGRFSCDSHQARACSRDGTAACGLVGAPAGRRLSISCRRSAWRLRGGAAPGRRRPWSGRRARTGGEP
jgi:hypothetical protein